MVTKRALLVGCNYRGASGINELNGCCNDARRLCEVLTRYYGFEGTNIDILVDEPSDGPRDKPTHANIYKYLEKLIDGVESGDILVLSFSGHGGLNVIPPEDTNDNTGWNEVIYPYDYQNLLTDDDFRDIVSRIPAGVNFTFISDSCSSGGLIDEMKEQIGGAELGENLEKQVQTWGESQGQESKRMTKDMLIDSLRNDRSISDSVDDSNICTVLYNLYGDNASLAIKRKSQHGTQSSAACKCDDVGILLSGCESWEYSRDVGGAEAHGVFTKALESVLEELHSSGHPSPTNRELITTVREKIEEEFQRDDDQAEPQHPCLYCSDRNADELFICDFVES